MKRISILLIFLITISLSAQVERFPLLEPINNSIPESFVFDNNNIKFPMNSNGLLATTQVGSVRVGAKFDDNVVFFEGGFALSGYNKGELWSNAMIYYVNDYTSGTVKDSLFYKGIYVVRTSQPDFYQSWIDWGEAVEAGAEFYDGDGDGVYNPVDKNENGQWDTDEDKPNIIGDITAFTVFNDGVESQDRTFRNVEPQGIEIKQTVFSYNSSTQPKLSNVIFVRYNIENMGAVEDSLSSVYFGAWVDIDIGSYNDDLFGTDTALSSFYCYNNKEDGDFGINPPACFISFIQGPPVYFAGETYSDINGNGVYDEGIDTPLDRAFNRKGELLGVDEYPGSKNNNLTATASFVKAHPTQGNPDDEIKLRYYLLGKNKQGELIDPCNWEYGEVFNEDCRTINPQFMYAGDPVTQSGWSNKFPSDQRPLSSTGPFNLVKGEPIEIIIAYIVGRGTDNLSSITEARRITNDVISFYNTNFSYVPVGVSEESKLQIPTEYSLYQNYPNPFNPSTTIRYSIPALQTPLLRGAGGVLVTLKIYDILGREVTTLVNKRQKAGNYEVQFDASTSSATASNLTSGVYFYQLHASTGSAYSFMESKKMILLK